MALFSLALLVRLVNLHILSSNPYFYSPVMDELHHSLWAQDVARGQGAEYLPFYRAPGYPYFLATLYLLAGPSLPLARIASSVLGAAAVVFLFFIGRKVFSTRVGTLAALTLTFYPMALYFDGMVLGTSLETFLVLAALLVLLIVKNSKDRPTPRQSLLLGLTLGLAAVTRPLMAVLAPVAIAFLAIRNPRPWSSCIAVCSGFLILPLAVTLLNAFQGGDFVLIAWNGGINFFLGNNAAATGWSATSPELRTSWWLGYLDAIRIASTELAHEARPSEVSAYWLHRGLDFLWEHPGSWLALTLRKLYLLLNTYEFSNNQSIQAFREYSPLLRVPLEFGVVCALAAPSLLSRTIWRGPIPWFILSYGLAVVLFFVTSRYRMPIVPLMVLPSVAFFEAEAAGYAALAR